MVLSTEESRYNYDIFNIVVDMLHWKPRVVMMQTLSSLALLEVGNTTTFSDASRDKVGMMTTWCVMPILLSLAVSVVII